MELNIPSPIQEITSVLLTEKGVRLSIKREDLIHPLVSGNKWRKLKFNIEKAKETGLEGVITFGGAFSNHIHATAAACKLYGLKCICLIRGEFDPLNPTTAFVTQQGGQIIYVTRTEYRLKEEGATYQHLKSKHPDYLHMPEGGSNDLALEGLKELAQEIPENTYSHISVSAGTGHTARGLIQYQETPVIVFSSLKSDYLKDVISTNKEYTYNMDYHFGGYGKTTDELIDFINAFYQNLSIPLDPIYNGKVLYGVMDMIRADRIERGSHILHIHTGGLQGIEAYNYMAQKKGKRQIVTNEKIH